MYGGGLQFNRAPAKQSFRTWQPPRGRNSMIMAPARTPSPSIPAPPVLPFSNLEIFLGAITPWVPVSHPPKGRRQNMGTYFQLKDLWESFTELSVYGADPRLVLYDGKPFTQYYAPSLSAMQIFSHQKPKPKSRKGIKDSEGECSSKGLSRDVSINAEWGKISTDINSHQTTNISSMLGKMSLREQKVFPQEGLSTDDSESSNSCGNLLFQYFDKEFPFNRRPLHEKISKLASQFPELKSMYSCHVHPNSWFSVAWYPVYRIPPGRQVNKLDTCFLTYHSLYTPMNGSPPAPGVRAPYVHPDPRTGSPLIALPAFGLSTYKFRASLWTGNNERIDARVNYLSNMAKDWVESRNVHHPDHAFFVSR